MASPRIELGTDPIGGPAYFEAVGLGFQVVGMPQENGTI
jgi:hypothetical protein